MPNLHKLINTDPDAFMSALANESDPFSHDLARKLDEHDPLADLHRKFSSGDIKPFAGHSLGPVFWPAVREYGRINKLQASKLHDGHFEKTRAISGNWFDCDIDPDAVSAMQPMLGFADTSEFIYTQEGLSANLGRLLSTFYMPSKADWESGKTGICYLSNEFFSDQAIIHSVLKRGILTAAGFDLFAGGRRPPEVDELCFKIQADARGLYSEDFIIEYVKTHARNIQILHLSDIVFSTGQRLDIKRILDELSEILQQHKIIVGLDLAHTVGNRPIDLKSLPVTYAVCCGYKYLTGSAGSGGGFYVDKEIDLETYAPIQGWKAARSSEVFQVIDCYNPDIMMQRGAVAFRCSNPSPVAIAPAQQYMQTMHAIGWDKLMARSESLTRYLLALLEKVLGDKIEFITPLDASRRGAMLVFRIKNLQNIHAFEVLLKADHSPVKFEVDTRPPNNIRVTAHYGYTRFVDIHSLVTRLEQVINQRLMAEQQERLSGSAMHGLFGQSKSASSDASALPVRLQARL